MVFKKQWVAVVVLVGIMVMSLCHPVYAVPQIPIPAPYNPNPEPVIPMPYEPNPDPIIPAPFNPNEEDAASDSETDSSEEEENKGLLERIIEELKNEGKKPIYRGPGVSTLYWFFLQYGDSVFRAVWGWVVDQAIILGKWVANQVVAAWNWTLNKAYAAWNWTKGKVISAWNWTKGAIAAWNWIFDLDTIKLDQVQLTDKQAQMLSDLVYKDVYGIKDDDLKDVFGVDENGDSNGIIIDRVDKPSGFEAIAVKNKATNEVVIAIRGSDTEDYYIDWWGQNLSIWQQFRGPQIDDADRFIKGILNSDETKGSTIILTGHSKGGFHSQRGAKKYGLPAITFNAPGLKPHPFYQLISPVQMVKTTLNPYMSIFRDPFNASGAYNDRVINYVNQDDVVGNYGVHFGKVVVVDDGGVQAERNDYRYPLKDLEGSVINKAVSLLVQGGTTRFREEHGLESFDEHFDSKGNIAR